MQFWPSRNGEVGSFNAQFFPECLEKTLQTLFHQAGETVARFIVFDEFHLTISVARELPESTCDAIRRQLETRRFQANLGKAIRAVFRCYPPLRKVRLRVTR